MKLPRELLEIYLRDEKAYALKRYENLIKLGYDYQARMYSKALEALNIKAPEEMDYDELYKLTEKYFYLAKE